MNRILFVAADFLSRPPGFYVLMVAMVACTALVPFGMTNAVTYALSVAAIVITGIVLIQGYRDTAAIHAKLDEIIVSLDETRNDVVGLEHAEPEEIRESLSCSKKKRQTEDSDHERLWPSRRHGHIGRPRHGICPKETRTVGACQASG